MKGEKGMENSREILQNVIGQVRQVVVGKEACVEKIMMAMLANGHVLMEDIPGVGKTTMAVAFARALGLEARRMQFTSDVLPSDITGFSVYRKDLQSFVYQPGAVFCNLFLADEINRTSPKTQSALLEVMEERQVTVEGGYPSGTEAIYGDRDTESIRFCGHADAAGVSDGPVSDLSEYGLSGAVG